MDRDATAMSLVDLAASLEKAAVGVRALDSQPSSEALEKQLVKMQESLTEKLGSAVQALDSVAKSVDALCVKLAHAQQVSDAHRSAENARLLAATQAASHAMMVRSINANIHAVQRPSLYDQRLLVHTAMLYGWKPDNKLPHEHQDFHVGRNWRSALECLLVVTMPSFRSGQASYDTFVK